MLKYITLIISIVLAGCGSTGLWVANQFADFAGYQIYENRNYGPYPKNTLDIYLPKHFDIAGRINKLPVVVLFYGGCWGGCETFTKEYYAFIAQALSEKGYVVIIPDYRLYPQVKFPQIIEDAAQSVEWVKQNIANFGGDPEQVFLMGHSAGAHLAAMLTLNEKYLKPSTQESIRGFIGLAGPYDFLPFTDDYQKVLFGPETHYPESQPINFVNGSEPPLLLLYGQEDKTVYPRNIENLTHVVKQLGGCVEPLVYEGLDHIGLLGSFAIPYQTDSSVLNDVDKFMRKYLKIKKKC